jgi:hypothetical protein
MRKYTSFLTETGKKEETAEMLRHVQQLAEDGKKQLAIGAELKEGIPPEASGYPQLLRFRKPITIDSFQARFEQMIADDKELQEQFSILAKFCERKVDLELASNLYVLLRMSNLIHGRYSGTLTRNGAGRITFAEAIKEVPGDEETWREAFDAYYKAWNSAIPSIWQFECRNRGQPKYDSNGKPNTHYWNGMPYIKPVDGGAMFADEGAPGEDPGWQASAESKSIKFALIDGFVEGGTSSMDPDSCMLDLLLKNCIEPHNDFVAGALRALNNVQEGIGFATDKMPLRLVREEDCMHFDLRDFDACVRANATQSLKYGQGADVKYDFLQIQNWVIEEVLKNAPLLDDRIRTEMPLDDAKKANIDAYFRFIGEGYKRKDNIGGIDQEELADDISGVIIHKELASLSDVQVAKDRLEECIGYLDIMGSATPQEADQTLDAFCTRVLQLQDDQLSDFGSASSAFRTAVQLKHLDSLMHKLDQRIKVGDDDSDVLETIAPRYRVDLSAEQKEDLEAAYIEMGLENLQMLHKGFLTLITEQFISFQDTIEPTGTTFNSGGAFGGLLEITETPDGSYFADQEWFDAFPMDITAEHLVDCYNLLQTVISSLE